MGEGKKKRSDTSRQMIEFDEIAGENRFWWVAIARCTGQRCRNVALQDVATCLKHGGRGLQKIMKNRAALHKVLRKSARPPKEIPQRWG